MKQLGPEKPKDHQQLTDAGPADLLKTSDTTLITAAGDRTTDVSFMDGHLLPYNESQESENEKGTEEIEQSKDAVLNAGMFATVEKGVCSVGPGCFFSCLFT